MLNRYAIGLALVGLLAVLAWAVAEQKQPAGKGLATESGHFVVSPAGDSAVLLDTKSGKMWV
jgi:hypothetical protein